MHRMLRFRSLVSAALLALALAAPARAKAPTPELPLLVYGNESAAYADGALGLLFNPAALGVRYPSDLLVSFARSDPHHEVNDEALSLGWIGFRARRVRDVAQFYGLGLAAGDEPLRFGWQTDVQVNGTTHTRVVDDRVGLLSRPAPWLSLGFVTDHLFEPEIDGDRLDRLYTLALGVRPLALDRARAAGLGTRLTVSGDFTVPDDGEWRQTRVRVGGELELVEGVLLRGSVEDHGGYHLGLTLRGPRSTTAASGAFAKGGTPGPTSYAIQVHAAEERSVLAGRSERRVGELRLHGPLADESLGGFSLFGGEGGSAVEPIHRALEAALEDPLTRGVLLDLGGVSNLAQIEELRPRIARLRAAGKPVVAWLEQGGGRGDLMLASACDRVVASPEAEFGALGLRAERRYYRRLLERWGVRIDRSSIGRYKSAFRNYSVDSIPPADREVVEHNLDVAQELFVSTVTADRRMPRERLLAVLDGREWAAAELAKAGLIDSVGYCEDAVALIGRLAGLGDKPRRASLTRVRSAAREWTVPARIAVIYASGGIQTGRSGNDLLFGPSMGSETVTRQVESAFRDRRAKAVVLRVESPGGSSLASDLIHHALARMKRETKKPLIVSMGAYAASGGYHIAAPGDRLFADRFTITGSIGVLTVRPSFEGWYAKHDVKQEEFDRGDYMRGWSQGRDWGPREQASADSAIARSYRSFVSLVAARRGLSYAAVDSVAQGRPWYAEDAKARGLVDEIGGLEQALAEARRRGGIPADEKIRLIEFRHPRPGLFQRVAGDLVRETLEREARLPDLDLTYEWDDLGDAW